MKTYKVAGINFDHMHMGDNLRMVHEHPNAEIVALCDEQPERMESAAANFGVAPSLVYTDYQKCLEETQPDIVVLCPATAKHAEWTKKVAPFDVHILMEKPFAASLAEADEMIAAMKNSSKLMAINWPLMWVESHRKAKSLIEEGVIGDVIEFHHYGGNRGPLYHLADKEETTEEFIEQEKPKSWFYKRSEGGGSMLDYLGYGTTLGTWYQGGKKPIEVSAVVDEPKGLEVDEHSIVIARYEHGLSKCETRWGTFTDPWIHQPQPRCGFTICGTDGTISSFDYGKTVHVQTRDCLEGKDISVDALEAPTQDPVQYLIHCIETGSPIEGPLSIEISRIGQQIVDTAFQSAIQKKTLPLMP